MSAAPLYIDGKLVTAVGARKLVQTRCPSAAAKREVTRIGHQRHVSVLVRERGIVNRTPWCSARAATTGEAWLKCVRQMLEHDTRIAAQKLELEQAVAALYAADRAPGKLETAALRYAAVRVRQASHQCSSSDERECLAKVLIAMAADTETRRDG